MSVAHNKQHTPIINEDPDQLIRALRLWGIGYLMSTSTSKSSPKQISDVVLVKSLVQCPYPRVRDACISLFVLHPELVEAVIEVYETGEPVVAEQVAVLTLAALYLQRLWAFQLTFALGYRPNFPEQPFVNWWKSRNLPAPQCQYGKAGLGALQALEQERRGLTLSFIGDWQNQIDHLLLQEATKHKQLAIPMNLLGEEHAADQEYDDNCTCCNVTRADIEAFLDFLGKSFHKAGRLYLAWGAALVHMGIRQGATMDIDVAIEASDEDEMVTAIRRIVEQMQINVEFASPGDFIPLPTQWMSQAHYVGRYGEVDVFYFDFYSLALSKISRGNDRDLIDVKLLLQQKVITLEELDAAYREVLPRMGKRPYINLDPQRFAERYAIVRQQLQQIVDTD
jgi:hypothetical protein